MCSALLAPVARAQPVALLDVGRAPAAVAIAGDQAIVARSTRHGMTIDALPADGGGAPVRILDLPAPEDGARLVIDLVAAPGHVAALVGAATGFLSLTYELYGGPVGGPLTLLRKASFGGRRPTPYEIDTNAAGEVLAMEFSLAKLESSAHIFAPGVTPVRVDWPETVNGPAALAGDLIAFLTFDDETFRDHIVVVDRRTGASIEELDVRDDDDLGDSDIDLEPDGRLVAAVKGRLVQRAPGVPRAAVPAAAGRTLASPVFAGASVAALERARYGAQRPVLTGAGARVLGAASTELPSLDAEGDRIVWLANGCVHADVPAPATTEQATCPAAEARLYEPRRIRGRTMRVRVACVAAPSACTGRLTLHSGTGAARARFSVPAGARRAVAVNFSRNAARRIRERQRAGHLDPTVRARIEDGRAYVA